MSGFVRRGRASIMLGAALLVACDRDGTAPKAHGVLAVTITGASATPSVTIAGPKGYTTTITASTTLTGLAMGTYTFTADSAVGPDSIVGTVLDTAAVAGSPATLSTHDTAHVTVTYAAKRHIGGIWVAPNRVSILAVYSSSQLHASDTLVAGDTISGFAGGPAGLAIDGAGNMWEAAFNSTSINMWTAAQRASGAQTPTVTLIDPALGSPENLTFDSNGNLWLADCGGSIVAFSAAQQAASNAGVTPAITMTSGAFQCPWSIAFDASGNAWVADLGAQALLQFTAAQVAAGGSQTPGVTITSGASFSPFGVSFDANGTLWTDFGNSVAGYAANQLTATGSPTPQWLVTITGGGQLFGQAFDHRGTLWVSDVGNEALLGLTSAQLTAGGAQVPAVTLQLPASQTWQPEQPVFDSFTATTLSASRVRPTTKPLAHQMRARHAYVNPNLERALHH
jgi:sugar lactone lactonase YvrE